MTVDTRELAAALGRLDNATRQATLERAALEGANIIAAAIRAHAPRDSGHLAQSIDSAIVREAAPGRAGLAGISAATPDRGRAVAGVTKDAFYARYVEFGHRLVRTVGTRAGRRSQRGRTVADRREGGTVPPHPFVRPAYDASKRLARRAIRHVLRVAVLRAVR